ncbi:type II toxin-antitoxin system ParD family antitoxin [Marinomonas sp. THO17]|uniref:type II toxin-antitoxin system ParD family antitoxin n=1 Tax=Marinomonas sp. THO17 TaxID=3149048 RepID=UPI00336BE60D
MATTSIDLGEHFTNFLSELKETGRYRNASEAVRAGLRLLEEQEAEYQTKLETLRQALRAGEESGESALTHEQIIAKAKAELNGE